ncbi:MAG: hypothetical protein ACRCYS_13110, partial [Beijerinckiaceae bacterium]
MDRHSAYAPPAAHDHLPVIRRDSGGITFLTLNEPERRNVLSQAMLVALKQHFAEIAGDRHVRAVVL